MPVVPGEGDAPAPGAGHLAAADTPTGVGADPTRRRRSLRGRRRPPAGPRPDPVWDELDVERSPLRSVVLVGGAAVTALTLTTGGFVLLNSREEPPGPVPVSAVPPTAPAAVPAAPPAPSPASEVQINARNPFAPRVALAPQPTSTDEGATGADAGAPPVAVPRGTTTVTTEVTITGPGATVTERATAVATTTTTMTDEAVWLTLISLAEPPTDDEAVMIVNGKKYTKVPGDSFGAKKRFTYVGTAQQDTGEWCAVVAYVDEELTICEGEQIQVH